MKKKILLTFVSILVLNILLKIWFLDSASIAWDEPFSIYHAQMSVQKIIFHLYNGNNPPGFEIILHYWIKIFGTDAFSVRFLPMIFSSLTAAMLFLLGNKIFNCKIGLLASLLFTFSNFHLFFAHEARVYALFGLLTVTSFYLFLSFIQSGKKSLLIGLVLANAMMLYCHYFGFFVIATQGMSVLLIGKIRKSHLLHFLLAGAAIVVLFLPNLFILFGRLSDSASNGTWIEKPTGFVNLYNLLWSFSNQPLNTVLCLAILVAAIVKLVLSKNYRAIQPEKWIIFMWFAFPFFTMFAISFYIPMFLDRYLTFVSFGYYLLIAISVDYVFERAILKVAALSILILIFAITFKPNLDNKRHVRETIAKIKELKDENTTLIICDHDFVLNFAYYYAPEIFKTADEIGVYAKVKEKLAQQNIYAIYGLPSDIPLKSKVIFLDASADFSSPNNNILPFLQQKYQLKATHHFETIFNIYEFQQ